MTIHHPFILLCPNRTDSIFSVSKIPGVMIFIALSTICLITAASHSLHAQTPSSPPYLIKANGERQTGCISLSASPDGTVTVRTSNGNLSFKKGQYSLAVVPKPDSVTELETLLDNENYNQIVKTAPDIFRQFCFLGWADTIARLQCQALIELQRFNEAETVYHTALTYPRMNRFALDSILLQLLVHKNKLTEAHKILNDILTDDDQTAAFVFNMRGKILELENKPQDAVLQYLKTILTTHGRKSLRHFRQEARANALRLMKEIGDPAAEIVEKLN